VASACARSSQKHKNPRANDEFLVLQRDRRALRAHLVSSVARLALRHRRPRREREYKLGRVSLSGICAEYDDHCLQEVLLVNLQDGKVVQQYHGCDSGSFITRSCFGGMADNYVLRGGIGTSFPTL